MQTAAERDDIIANINLNLKQPAYHAHARYWFVKHTNPENGKLTETRFTSQTAAYDFYEEMYRLFEANYISIKAKQYYNSR